MTQEFSVSSRGLAVGAWILAVVLPWFIAACIKGFGYLLEAAQTNLRKAEKNLEEAKKAGDSAKISELTTEVEVRKQALTTAQAASWWERWKFRFNPIWIVSG